MIDKNIHNFYIYFTVFLVVVVAALGGYLYYLNKPVEIKLEKYVVLETNLGTIKLELFLEQSPITAENFKKLVEEGFYDRTRFHRVIPDFMIQGGDPFSKDETNQLRWGAGDAGYKIEDEFIEGLSNKRGTLSMANSGPNSGSSQFFINTKDNTFLDWDKAPSSSKHPVFGKVIEGMDLVDNISIVETDRDFNRPLESVIINKAYITSELN